MQATRRPSVSDLNLEEILLAMADSDKAQSSHPSQFPTGTIKPRPLPTPQPRNRSGSASLPRQNTFPQDIEQYRHSYHTPEHIPNFPQGEMASTLYSMSSPYQQAMYEGDTGGYGYQYTPQNVAYYQQEEMYAYGEAYLYPAEQPYTEPYGEYYQEYAYYTPEQAALANPEYYYPYEYPVYEQPYEQPYGHQYSQQYGQAYYVDDQSQLEQELSSANLSRSATTKRPLPRLPPKKKKEQDAGRDINLETPNIQSLQRLSIPTPISEPQSIYMDTPQQSSDHSNYLSSQHYQQNEEIPNFPPPPISHEEEANHSFTESQDNLAALMADITLHLSGSSSSVDSRVRERSQILDSSPNSSTQMLSARTLSVKQPDLNSSLSNSVTNSYRAAVPDSPAPPPRLTKEAAEMRLKNSPSRMSSPMPVNSYLKDSRSYQPSTSSPLVNIPQNTSKVSKTASRTSASRPIKKGPIRVLSSAKPQNSIHLVNASKPVTDSGADGFDFDESDFESIDRAVMAMTIPSDISLENLVHEHLIPNLRQDWQRIRVIFLWIVENIRYDSQLLPVVRGPSPNPQSSSEEESGDEDESRCSRSIISDDGDEYLETPKSVLLRRACRQFGFANLFKAMAASAGLECEIIEGFLKDPNDASEPGKTPEANHAWICVKIQGYYRFIDCGLSVPSHPYNVHKKMDLFYFLTNPAKLIFTHFPLSRAHQYLRPPIPFSNFTLLPFVTSTYFDFGVRFLDLPDGVLTIHEDQTGELNLSIPEEMKCWAEIEIPDPSGRGVRRLSPLVQCRAREEGRMAKVMLRVKGKSPTALLRFRCGYPQESKQLPYCFSLRLAHTGIKAPEEFVKILPSPAEFFIMDPLNFDLLYNIAYRFHVLPGSSESRHFKLALRSPSMKIHKFVYYPGDQGYVANVTLRERGQWAISYMVQSKEERPSKRDPWINVACYRCI